MEKERPLVWVEVSSALSQAARVQASRVNVQIRGPGAAVRSMFDNSMFIRGGDDEGSPVQHGH